MQSFDIQVLHNCFLNKPKRTSSDKNIYAITSALLRKHESYITISSLEDMIDAINKFGVIQPHNSHHQNSSLIFLDFDKNVNVKEALKVAEQFDLTPTLIYKTLSEDFKGISKKEITKFRMVYMFDKSLDLPTYKTIILKLHKMFKTVDKSTKNHDRWYFTGRKNKTNIIFKDMIHQQHIVMNKLEMFTLLETPKVVKSNVQKQVDQFALKDIKFNDIVKKCKLFKDHTKQKQLEHKDKLILATNLSHIENGRNYFINYLQVGVNTKSVDKWNGIMDYSISSGYKPTKCKSCKKYSNCKLGKLYGTLYDVIRCSTPDITEDDNKTTISLEEARKQLHTQFTGDLENAAGNEVFVYKVQAGIGKTYELTKNFGRGVYAFPSHNLKDEKIEDIKANGFKPFVTPNVFDLVTKESDREIINNCYRTGNSFLISKIVKKYPEGNKFLQRSNIPLVNGTVTTHHKLNRSNFSPDVNNIFYDEDPTQTSLFYHTKANYVRVYDDLKKLKKLNVLNQREVYNTKRFINNLKKHKTPKHFNITEQKREMANKILAYMKSTEVKLKSNVIEFLTAEYFSSESYSVLYNFAPSKNIFIFSATPDMEMIEAVAKRSGKTVTVRTVDNVERVGKLKQKIISTSRSGFKRNEKELKEILAENSDLTITFKGRSGSLNNNELVPYGGNTLGFNFLKGQDLNIAYTFQLIPDYYYHKYVIITDKQLKDTTMNRRRITFKNKNFVYYCYDDKRLRNIVFNNIDSEMIQALERSRTISEDCTSTVLSEFMCSIIDRHDIEYI